MLGFKKPTKKIVNIPLNIPAINIIMNNFKSPDLIRVNTPYLLPLGLCCVGTKC